MVAIDAYIHCIVGNLEIGGQEGRDGRAHHLTSTLTDIFVVLQCVLVHLTHSDRGFGEAGP